MQTHCLNVMIQAKRIDSIQPEIVSDTVCNFWLCACTHNELLLYIKYILGGTICIDTPPYATPINHACVPLLHVTHHTIPDCFSNALFILSSPLVHLINIKPIEEMIINLLYMINHIHI